MKRVFTKLAFRDFSLVCSVCSALATKGVGKVLLTLMLIGLCSSSALAATISIGTGENYTTLSAANGNLNDGDTLILTSDVNVGGNITWTKNITIQGNGHVIKRAGNDQRIKIQSTVSLDGVVLDGDRRTPSQCFITISGTSSKLIMDAASKITNVGNNPAVNLDGGSLIGGQITRCTNTNNKYGIVYVSSTSSVLSNCRITENTIRDNDAACVVYLMGRMVNCVVAENEKESGIYYPQAVAAYDRSYVINCTIVSNSNLYGYFRISGTSYLYNSIIYGNSDNISWSSPIYSNCVTTNPNLSSDYSLTANSTDCINRGNNTCFTANSTLSTDIVGNPRFTGTIDVGAYELGANIYYAKLTAKYGNTDCTNKMGTLTSTPAIPSWSQDANHLYSFAISSGSSSTQDVTVNVENASFDVTTGTGGNRVTTTYIFDHWETSDGTVVSGNTLTFKQDKNNANQYVAIYKKPSYFWMNAQTEDGVEIGRSKFSNVPGLVYDGKNTNDSTQNKLTVNRFSTTIDSDDWSTRMPEITINDELYEFDHWEKVSGEQTRTGNGTNRKYSNVNWTNTFENPILTTSSNNSIWSGWNNNKRTCTYYTAVYKVKGTTYYATLTAKGNDGTPLSSEFTSADQTLRHASDLYSFTITPKQDNITTKDVSVTPVATKQTITKTIDGEQITYTFDHWELNGVKVTGPLTFNVNKTAANYVAIYKSDKCADIQASKTQNIHWGDRIDLTVNDMDESFDGEILNFQWQSSTDGRTWTNIAGDEAKEEEYSFIAQSGFHLYYRLAVTPRGESSPCYSNAVKLSSAACSEPTLSVTGPGVTVLKEELIYEVNAGSSFTIAVNTVNVPNFSCILKQTPLQRTGTVTLTPTRFDNSGYIYQISNLSDSYTYKLTYKNCNGSDVTKEFNVRVVYKCTSSYSEQIWFDDFGEFKVSGNDVSYIYNNNGTITTETVTDKTCNKCGTTTKCYHIKEKQNAVQLTYNQVANDGYYNITNDSYCGMSNEYSTGDQFGHFSDHTGSHGDTLGAMMFANLKTDSKDKKIYIRPFKVDCEDAYVIFSMYVANANQKVDGIEKVNVRLDIFEINGGDSTLKAQAFLGDIPSRETCPQWHNLSARFNAKMDKQYVMALTSNKNGGTGNDALIDDISITVCYPDVSLSDDPYVTNENHHMAVCGKDKSDASVYVSCSGEITDYFENPLFLYQYQDAEGKWHNLTEGDNPYSSESGFNVDLKDERLSNNQGFRVIVAKDRVKLDAIMNTYKNTGAFPKVACDNYYGISNENFTIAYYPDLGELGDENHLACPNDEVTLHKDLTGYNDRRWYDKNWNEITSARGQDSYTFTMGRSTQTHYLVVAAEEGICADTATFRTSVNRRVALTCEDITLQTEENASSCSVQYTLVHPTASSCSSDQFTYYYNITSKTSPYILFTEGTSLTVEDGDVIYWVVVMDNDVTLTDTCSQSIIVADSTAPVLAAISDSLLDFSLNGCVYKIPDLSTVALSAATDNCTDNLTFVEQSVSAGYEYTQTDAQQTIPVVVKVKDEAGNIGEQTVNVIIPANDFSFVCANYAFLSEDGQIEFDCPAVTPAGSVVEWSTNNTALSTTGGKISGTLPFGNTTVTISAKKCDKKVDCSTTITVIKRADACGHDE